MTKPARTADQILDRLVKMLNDHIGTLPPEQRAEALKAWREIGRQAAARDELGLRPLEFAAYERCHEA